MALFDQMWDGDPCLIIGGGPSALLAKGFSHPGVRTIAVNRAHEILDADLIFSCDRRFFSWTLCGMFGEDIRQRFLDSGAQKALCWSDAQFSAGPGIQLIPCLGRQAWGFSIHDGLGQGNSSGFGAINLAEVLGCNPIYLIGFEMHGRLGKQLNFHSGYPIKMADRYLEMRSFFEWAEPLMMAQVINLTPDSALRCFPEQKWEEAFSERYAAA